MDNFKLSNIKIGYADGEKEAAENDFSDLFYTNNNKYNDLLSKHKFIVSGRKGTGKTILAKYYQRTNSDGSTIIDYSKLNNISLHELIDLDSVDLNEDIRFLFQEYYIYKHFVQTINDNKKDFIEYFKTEKKQFGILKTLCRYRKYTKNYNYLHNLYKKYYPDGPYNEKDIKTIAKVVKNSTLDTELSSTLDLYSKLGANLSTSSENVLEITKEKKNFAERSEQFKKIVLECLKYISVAIIIDDLDEIRTKDTEHLISFLVNLVTKVNDINMNLLKVNNKSKCILLLRSDIINLFAPRSANIQKIISDSNVELEWFKSGSELEKMILFKIRKSDISGKLNNLSYDEIKRIVFSLSSDKKNSTFDRILRFSFGRPRDVITYINDIISLYPNNKQITFTLVKEAESIYSRSLLNEIENEMQFALKPDEINDIEKLLRNFGKPNFKYKDIIDYYSEHKSQYPAIKYIDKTLQYLYQLGLIGNYKSQKFGKKRKNIYAWSYRNGGETLDTELDITIHLGVRKALNIV